MSRVKKLNLAIILLIAIISGVMFGCGKSKPVKDIFFSLDAGEQIVLIVGESLEMDDYISIKPSNATNKKYSLSSFNEDIVKIENGSIVAVSEGSAQVKVVSKDNKLKQDLMSVVVKNTKTVLETPRNLVFNRDTQRLTFDKVTYATSYTLKINNEEISLGNSNVYSLSKYSKSAYNNLLNIQVKANSPTYTKALEDSSYSSEYKLYQAGGVDNVEIRNGVLSFDKSFEALKVNLYLGDLLVVENSDATNFSLKELHEDYTGVSTQVKIETVVTDEIKDNYSDGVNYFNSNKQSINLNILDAPIVSVSHSTLSWQNIPYCAGYSILVDDEEVAIVHENYINLATLEDFDEIISAEDANTLVVEPIINDLTPNVGRTTKVNPVRVKRLEETEISCVRHGVEWTAVDNALTYAFILECDDESYLEISTDTNSYSLLGQAPGNYHLQVQAVGGYIQAEDVYYLSSKPATIDFSKSEGVTAEIENYVLKVSDLGTSTCYVEFTNPDFNTTLKEDDVELDLADLDFAAGKNTITLTRKDGGNSVLSEEFVLSFVQLDAVLNLRIEDGVVKFDTTNANANATITLKTSNATEVVYTVEDIVTDQHRYNSTDVEGENYLPAGKYEAAVFVEGDGSSTFSVREGGEVVPQTCEFEVLDVPNLELKNVHESILIMKDVENAKEFNVYYVNDGSQTLAERVETNSFEFVFAEPVSYAVQSIGNGSTTLNSVVGTAVTIEKLQAPTLTYNSATEMFVQEDSLNDSNLVKGYELSINGEVIEYDFATSIDLSEDTVATLKAIPVDRVDQTLYLASDASELVLTKISNEVELVHFQGEFGYLLLLHETLEELDFEVEFTFGVEKHLLKSDGNYNLLDDKDEIVTTYSWIQQTEGEYIGSVYTLEIMQEDRFIYEELLGEFDFRVRFINKSTGNDTLINSEFSELLEGIALSEIINDAKFTVNENSQLVIFSETNYSPRGLVLVVNGDEDLTFKSDGTKLVSNDGCELPYTYDMATQSYLINLLDEGYNVLNEAFNSEFTVKVKLTLYQDTTETNRDTDFGDEVTVHTLPTATIAREGQNLKITHPQNDYTYNNYGLLINNSYLLRLTEEGITQCEGGVLVDMNYVFNSDASSAITDTNTVTLIVLNIASDETYLELSKSGNTLSIHKTQAVQLREVKDNGVDANSVMIEFETYETNYNKDYFVNIYNDSGDLIKPLRYVDGDADENGIISISIDEIEELPDVFYIEAYVGCLATDGENEVFNSNISNRIELTRITTTSELKVSDSVLTFAEVENAIGYEIYEKTGTGYVKINTGLVPTNQYTFADLTGTKQIVVKAISNFGGFTNSLYSEPITISSMSELVVKVESGEFFMEFPSQVETLPEGVVIIPEITDHIGNVIEIDLAVENEYITEVNSTTIKIASQYILGYNTESLQVENLLFKLRVRYDNPAELYYLNTPVIEFDAHGLLAPTNVRKITDSNTKVEFITWTPNANNKINDELVEVGYEFKIERTKDGETQTYYSTDTKLKYYDSAKDEYLPYSAILTDANIVFPAGYDSDNNGELDIEFADGLFRISVRTVPNCVIDGYNFCNSLYASASEFEILAQTELYMDAGVLAWNEQASANKYKVEVYEYGETETLVTDYVETAYYDFTNPTLNTYSGVLRVVVTAISERDDTINGLASTSIYVYRLPEATAVHVDDGKLIVSANKFFSIAKVEFVDTTTGKTYVETYENPSAITNISGLGITTWEDLKDENGVIDDAVMHETFKFALSLDAEVLAVLDGRDYTINVTLHGNSNDAWGTITSSKTVNVSKLKTTKMNANLTEVSLGELQFMPNSNYATITTSPAIAYNSLVDLNYSFNGATSTAFWHNTAVYKIRIEKSNSSVNVYAVDYYSLMAAIAGGTIAEEEYEILERTNGLYAIVKYHVSAEEVIYFNVYKDNKLNLRDFDEISYFEVEEKLIAGVNSFESSKTEKTINLADGGSFVISITMLGGDSQDEDQITVGQLNAASAKLKTFIRYGVNTLSSSNGRLQFVDMMPTVDGVPQDEPVYRVVVTPFNTTDDRIFYLYHNSIDNARTIADRFGDENVNFYQLVKEEGIEGFVFFDLSEHIGDGTYKITIQTLAGLGVEGEDQADYLLNAKAPATAYTFYRLTNTQFTASEGVLMFDQSYIVRDGEKIYNEEYEIILSVYETELSSYSQRILINRTSENVEFDDVNHIVKYYLPSQIEFGGDIIPISPYLEHKIKVRAVSSENFILNGTYNKQPSLEYFEFTKSKGVQNLRVEDGILKWTVLDIENHTTTVIKVTFLDSYLEPHNIFITVGNYNIVEVDGAYQYHYYNFTSEKFNGFKIESGVDYVISAYTTGQGNVLNSSYCSEINAYRLPTIDSSSIKTVNGILTWEAIQDAYKYEVTINGETHTCFVNELNVAELNLEAGTYSVNIKSVGTNVITSEPLTYDVQGFIQLDTVKTDSIQAGGNKITWEAVEGAQGYKVLFNYTDLAGNSQTVEDIVTSNEFVLDYIEMQGTFTISITAVGVGEGKVFNGRPIEYTSSSDAPTGVAEFSFDHSKNRFVIDVNNAEFLTGDSLVIVYNFEEYTSQLESTVARRITTTINYQQTDCYEIIDEYTTRYYLPITIMGKYTNINVQVDRPNTLSSTKKQTDDVDFHLFSYGNGTVENPYRIYNAEQLLNISYFPSGNYVMISSVNLTGIDISARLEAKKAVIAKEFSGVLDGNNFSIIGFNADDNSGKDIISLENVSSFALFETLSSATIKNLIIGKEDIQLIVSNTFTSASVQNVKYASLAISASNSTIDNIKVLNHKVELNSSMLKTVGGIYVGGLINEVINSTISNSSVNFTAKIDLTINNIEVYIGGVSAKATKANLNNTQITMNVETKSENMISYIGGAFAYFEGNAIKSTGITGATAELNITNVQASHVGGLVGFARYIKIETSETTGTYTKSNIAYNAYVGGLIGRAESATINNSGSFMNLNLTVSNTTNKFIGAIVGRISVYNGVSSDITNCYSNVYVEGQEETVISTSGITLGMFGEEIDANIQGNYKKEQE